MQSKLVAKNKKHRDMIRSQLGNMADKSRAGSTMEEGADQAMQTEGVRAGAGSQLMTPE